MSVTKRQREVLDFITDFQERNHYCPSFEEIARGLDLRSLATVHKHIDNLEKKGLLQRSHNRSRSIDISSTGGRRVDDMSLPLLGRIAAGVPVEAAEIAESLSLSEIVGTRNVFALQVKGDSMREEHIVDGDFVLVEKAATAKEGAIVVALVRGCETTLKRFYLEGDTVRLQPSNAAMAPIRVPASDVAIQGRVLAIVRRCN